MKANNHNLPFYKLRGLYPRGFKAGIEKAASGASQIHFAFTVILN